MKIYLILLHSFSIFFVKGDRKSVFTENGEFLPHIRLAKDLTDIRHYDNRVRPVLNHSVPTKVSFSLSLYQILAINEKMQNIDLNVWVIQKWKDEFLGWNPKQYGLINSTILPYNLIWLPDTYLYNSVVMNREETERYINVEVTTEYWKKQRGAQIKLMYPALYRTSCRIQIRYFPYDQQNCTMLISSWTSDKSLINYVPEYENVNLDNFIPNEEWIIINFEIRRIEEKFVCCPIPWVLLEASLVVRRKPLYYIVNLIIPTSIITLVAVTGFFTPASTSSERREKLSLGIDSLLAMSILMMMVSEQMPTTSDYVPLFGLFYLSIIFIIFIGTLFTAFVLNVHLQKIHNKPVPPIISYYFFYKIAPFLSVSPSTVLYELWLETGMHISDMNSNNNLKQNCYNQLIKNPEFDDSFDTLKSTGDKMYTKFLLKNQNKFSKFDGKEQKKEENINFELTQKINFENKKYAFNSSIYDMNKKLMQNSTPLLPSKSYFNAKKLNAQKNWRCLARHASLKHNELSDNNLPSTTKDIPFVDISPERLDDSSYSLLHHEKSQPTNIPQLKLTADVSFLPNFNSSETIDYPNYERYNKHNKKKQNLKSYRKKSLNTQLYNVLSAFNRKSSDVAILDAKLRRRYAHEWKYLATILDRLLLIIFSALVVVVTSAMLIVGELLQIFYNFDYVLPKNKTL